MRLLDAKLISLALAAGALLVVAAPVRVGFAAELSREQIEQKIAQSHGKPIDLADLDLSGLDLSGLDLHGADFFSARLADARLAKANLSGVNFTRCRRRISPAPS
jgi:uncharacterized protein YjbI with pentapeptide repeats